MRSIFPTPIHLGHDASGKDEPSCVVPLGGPSSPSPDESLRCTEADTRGDEEGGRRVGRRRAALGTFAGASANMAAASLQAILLTPLVLRSVGVHLYGAWLASGEVLVWMLAFDFGIPNLLIQRVGAAHAREDYTACGEGFAAGMVALGGLALGLALVLCSLAPFVPGWLRLSGAEAATLRDCFVVASLATCTMLLDYGLHGLARGLQDTRLIYRFAVGGTLLGFALTAVLLLSGWGLMAVAVGLVVRVGVAFLGSLVWFARVDARIRRACRVRREVLRELLATSPPMFLSGVAVAVMNNSGVTLAAVLLGPSVAAVYGITKRAADLARSLADMVGYASYGGFAHLHAGDDPARTRAVYGEIHGTYTAVALALLSTTVAVNPSLVATWTGAASFAGLWTSLLVALAALAGGWSYLAVSLLRATGAIKPGSWAVVLDCVLRLPLMAALTSVFGLVGLPVAGLVTTSAVGLWAHRRCVAALEGSRAGTSASRGYRGVVQLGVLLIALLISFTVRATGWTQVLPLGFVLLALFGGALVLADPRLRARLPRPLRLAARAA